MSTASPPRPRLLLHIGTHKTGTTTLQHALARSRQRLAQAGVLYAATNRPPLADRPKHTSVWQAAARGTPEAAERERQTLLTEFQASGAHTLVISAEGLSEPVARIPAFFAPLARQFDIQVVCLLRRPDLFAEALYNQFVRVTTRQDVLGFAAFLASADLQARLHYHRWLDGWRQQLPDSRISLLDYDAVTASGQSLVAAFCSTAGWPTLPVAPGERRVNPSPDMRLAQLLGALRQHRLPHEPARLMAAARQLEQRPRWPRQRVLLSRAARVDLLAGVAEDTQALAHDFGLRFGDPAPDLPEPEIPADQLPQAYLLALLAQLSREKKSSPD